jgi:anoctamin-8
LQLLAALLITRQVMGNLKESLLPYAKKQLKLAKMSFDLFGALSPSTDRGKVETELIPRKKNQNI